MRKLVLFFFLIAACAPAAWAQTDYNKVDVSLGYSHLRADTGIGNDDPEVDDIFDEREGLHGVEGSIAGNFSRYLGAKADYAFHWKSFDFADGVDSFSVDVQQHNLVGGIQIKDNATETKVKPFAHLMAGVAHAKFKASDFDISESETGFSGIIGGGIDIKVNDRVDVRAIQFDYNPTRLGGEMQHNFRIGVGLVFR